MIEVFSYFILFPTCLPDSLDSSFSFYFSGAGCCVVICICAWMFGFICVVCVAICDFTVVICVFDLCFLFVFLLFSSPCVDRVGIHHQLGLGICPVGRSLDGIGGSWRWRRFKGVRWNAGWVELCIRNLMDGGLRMDFVTSSTRTFTCQVLAHALFIDVQTKGDTRGPCATQGGRGAAQGQRL